MRASGEQLKSASTEGRFNEASQRDVLALAARLQKEHFETMSASEIEQAAVEGGMNADFVREAIRRISAEPQSVQGAPQEKFAPSEVAVAIFVPLCVFGVFLLKYLASHPYNHVLNLGVAGFGLLLEIGLIGLAVVGARSLLAARTATTSFNSVTPQATRSKYRPVSVGAAAVYGLITLTLLTLPFRSNDPALNQALFLAIMAPFLGGFERQAKIAFWKGAALGGLVTIFVSLHEAVNFGTGLNPGSLPAEIAATGACFGLLSLAGFGLKRLFVKETPARVEIDRTEMLTKLFELQAALDRHQETRTFLSVDVVGSSSMKAAASELEVEFSFRQYQTWIAETVRGFGGEVQLSAGDGAMAMFKDPASAVAAARHLQIGVDEFNTTKNRLSSPFRIRCGIAEGRIGIDARTPLGQIQSPVLDRAAFLQKYAEPGSVVVTKELIEAAMPVLGSLHQREMIDGKAVYSWP